MIDCNFQQLQCRVSWMDSWWSGPIENYSEFVACSCGGRTLEEGTFWRHGYARWRLRVCSCMQSSSTEPICPKFLMFTANASSWTGSALVIAQKHPAWNALPHTSLPAHHLPPRKMPPLAASPHQFILIILLCIALPSIRSEIQPFDNIGDDLWLPIPRTSSIGSFRLQCGHLADPSSACSPTDDASGFPSLRRLQESQSEFLQSDAYISYGALKPDRVICPPMSGRSYYDPNCRAAAASNTPANPYQRGCSAIARCARDIG